MKQIQQTYSLSTSLSKINYLLFLPLGYDRRAGVAWPLMIFLHGRDQRGDTQNALQLLKKEGPPGIVEEQPDFPIWVFHGARDDVVLPYQSEVLVEALMDCGADVRFTLYPNTGHAGAWRRAYTNPTLYEWLLEQKLGD